MYETEIKGRCCDCLIRGVYDTIYELNDDEEEGESSDDVDGKSEGGSGSGSENVEGRKVMLGEQKGLWRGSLKSYAYRRRK